MLVGIMVLADEEKPEAHDAVSMLRKSGIRVYMITGDNKHTAKAIAEKVCRYIIYETMSVSYCVSLSYSMLLALSACVKVTVLTFLSTCALNSHISYLITHIYYSQRYNGVDFALQHQVFLLVRYVTM